MEERMPTYEYACKKCRHRFEKFQKMTDKPVRTCPKCRGKVERLIGGGAGVIFKGSGFYQTDYRSKSYHEAAKKDKAEPSKDKPAEKGCGSGPCQTPPPASPKDKKSA